MTQDRRSEPDSELPTVARPVDATGRTIRGYQVLQMLGEGGMGIVYEAEQEKPVRRRVALKVIRPGMDTGQVVARFEAERQALALMSHPSIASIFDGGATEDGRPYFAMELVHGDPLTEYCDKHRLMVRERLNLFLQVCDGVQHAHQKGIIHRDIKPSNILVTIRDDKPVPKIIDFGVAKATSQRLTEKTLYTQLGQWMGTPVYMSPEQAEMTGADVDTRTDVYALGVVLYELLAGALPFDPAELKRAGFDGFRRILRETEPPKPSSRVHTLGRTPADPAGTRRLELSALERELRGDLDWITMKALEKDRVRRYETAHALALDVRRHLDDEPVIAGPPSSMLRAVNAERQAANDAAEARRQTAIAEAVNDFLNEDLLAAVAPSANRGQGKDVTMREALAVAAERIDKASTDSGRFANQPLVEASIRLTIADTYRELGEYSAAEPHVRRALDLRLETLGEEHPESAAAMNDLALLRWRQGRLDEAEPLYRRAYEIGQRVLGEDHIDTLAYEMNLANLYRWQGRFQEAESLYEHNLEAKLRVLGAEDPSTLDTMGNLANHFQETGRYERAEALHRQALETRRRVQGEKAPRTVSEMNNLANDLALLGRLEEAEPLTRRALELKTELYGGDHPSTLNSVSNLGELNGQLGRDAEAELLHRQALEVRARVLGPSHPRTLLSKERLAATLSNRGRFAEAERLAAEAVAQSTESLGVQDASTLSAQDTRARALLGLGRAGEAESILRRQLAVLEEKRDRGEDPAVDDALAHELRVHLGMTLTELGRRTEAEALLLESIPELPPRDAATSRALEFLVRFYEEWDSEQPHLGHAARAAEWRQRLKDR
jgi:serine/threonine protein kinase/Tfp pilus assembly protein PilF